MDKQCLNTVPHDMHSYPQRIEKTCSGITACGKTTHKEHQYWLTETFWCLGICNCGLYEEKHGPGAHK